MKIVQITPGAGGMFCGNCLRDNSLVRVFRERGHPTLMIPLYLPMALEDTDQSQDSPIFFSGINVYLDQKSSLFRHAPEWLHRLLASRKLLSWVSKRATQTEGREVAEMTLSMFQGEEGKQARELEELIRWLKAETRPDVVCLSNALLLGMARRLREALGCPVVCMLQGEDAFLDRLPSPYREEAWKLLRGRGADADLFVAPTRYFADRMRERLDLPSAKMRVVPNGIYLDGFEPAQRPPDPPVIGYFARMCPEKGLEALVEAFLTLKRQPRWSNLRLRVGGGLSPGEASWVRSLQGRLEKAGWAHDAEFCPNLSRSAKLDFLRSLTVLSTPALYGEAFGLYILEALAAGVPVVQPRHAAFPELLEATEGGILYDPEGPASLADSLQALLLDPEGARRYGKNGRRNVLEHFSIQRMAENMLGVFDEATQSVADKTG